MAYITKRRWTHKGVTKFAYQVVYNDMSGKESSKQFPVRKDAERFKRQVENELEAGIHVPAKATKTVAEAAKELILWYRYRWEIREIAGNTYHNMVNRMRANVIPTFGRLKLTEVTTEVVQAAIWDWASRYSRKTISGDINYIKILLDFAVTKKWLKRNIVKDDPPKRPKPKPEDSQVKIPEKHEIKAIIQALADARAKGKHERTHRNRVAIIFLAMFCGLRNEEICGLQWENVDFEKNEIRVRHAYTRYDRLKGPKSAAGVREVPFQWPVREALLRVLDYWQVEQNIGECAKTLKTFRLYRDLDRSPGANLAELPTGHVIRGANGKPLVPQGTTRTYLHPVLRAAGLWPEGQKKPPFRLHTKRHVYASLMIEAGLPVMQLSRVLGHKNVSMTLNVYAHLFKDDTLTRKTADLIAAELCTTTSQQGLVGSS